jgi:nucleoside 2-deoxyribosyltransferase
MNIYIAGPFSQKQERESLKEMISIIEKRFGVQGNIYIPMDYKVPDDFQKLDGTWNLSNQEWAKRVYESDIKHLNEADIVFALYTGHYCSSGSIWEIGYACGKEKSVVLYIPEWVNLDVSLMVMNGVYGQLREDGTILPFTEEDLKKYNQK